MLNENLARSTFLLVHFSIWKLFEGAQKNGDKFLKRDVYGYWQSADI
jgi:hypothetical protein